MAVRELLTAVLLTAVAAAGASAQKRYTIPLYDVTLAVRPDGSYAVTERIEYDFQGEPFTHADRRIPLRYIGSFTFEGVTADGARLGDVRPSIGGREARIEWRFAPKVGSAAFTLGYVVRGVLFASGGRDIVDWDAIGRDWRVPIANARVAVLLPAALVADSGDIHALPAGGRISRSPDGWRIDYAYGPLAPGTAYRVVVGFPQRVAGRGDWPGVQGWATTAGGQPSGVGPAGALLKPVPRPFPASFAWLLPLAALAGLLPGIFLFVSWGPPKREVVAPAAPPTSLARGAAVLPATSGALQRVFAAMLFDLASRGHLTLRRVLTGKGMFAQKKVEVVLQDRPGDPLDDMERLYLEQLQRYQTLDDFGRKGGRFRHSVTSSLRRQLVEERLMEDHGGRSAAAVAAAILSLLLAVLLLATHGTSLLPAATLLFFANVGLLLAATRMRVPTDSGALLRGQVAAYMAALRGRIDGLARTSPVQAAEAYLRDLPWLTLDPKVTPWWLRRIVAGLKQSDGELATPGWASDLADTAVTGSAAYAAFMPYYHVAAATAGAASPGAGGAGAAGAGAGGGAGGGGGGAG